MNDWLKKYVPLVCDEGTEYGTPFLMNNKKKEKGKTTLFKVRLKCPEDSSCSFCRHIMMDEEKQTWKIETPPLESQRVRKGKKKNGYEHNDSCKLYEKYSYNTPQRITKKWRDLKPKTQVENQEDGNSTEEEPVEVSEEQTNHLFQIKLVERAKEKEFYKITKKSRDCAILYIPQHPPTHPHVVRREKQLQVSGTGQFLRVF